MSDGPGSGRHSSCFGADSHPTRKLSGVQRGQRRTCSTTALVTDLFPGMPLSVVTLIGIEGVPWKGLLISAVSSIQLKPRACRSASSAAWSRFMSNGRSFPRHPSLSLGFAKSASRLLDRLPFGGKALRLLDLIRCHPVRHDVAVLGGAIAIFGIGGIERREIEPFIGLHVILRRALAVRVEKAEMALGEGIAALCRFAVPGSGLRKILRHPLAVFIQ